MAGTYNPFIRDLRDEFGSNGLFINISEEDSAFIKEYVKENNLTYSLIIHSFAEALKNGSVRLECNRIVSDKPTYIKEGQLPKAKNRTCKDTKVSPEDTRIVQVAGFMNGMMLPGVYTVLVNEFRRNKVAIINKRFCVIRTIYTTENGEKIR